MKSIISYISETLKINSKSKINKFYCPKSTEELIDLIEKLIKERGNNADLNDIDTSKITSMSYVFSLSKFNGDISKWDVSNVTNMNGMFEQSSFDGDISNWDVSNVKNMKYMFTNSKFTSKKGDISNWDVSNVIEWSYIFWKSPLQNNPPKWYKED